MENTLENKAKFFAQYWGQPIFRQLYFSQDEDNDEVQAYCLKSEKGFLNIKPISSITYKDASAIAEHYEKTAHNIQISSNQIIFDFYYGDITQSAAIDFVLDYCVDYLRSKGYATPYMGLSVEKQIEYGWIKLN